MLSLAEVAVLEEGRLAAAFADIAAETLPVAGAVAGRGEPGSWQNTVMGLGMFGPVAAADVARIVDWFVLAGVEPRVELCPYAHASAVAELVAAGFVVNPALSAGAGPTAFETVLFRELAVGEPVTTAQTPGPGITITTLDPADDAMVDRFARFVLRGFMPDGVEPLAADLESVARASRHPRTTSVLAWAGSPPRLVGVAACEIGVGPLTASRAGAADGDASAGGAVSADGPAADGTATEGSMAGVAALFGAVTAPEFRRRGVQQALLAARMNMAREAWRERGVLAGVATIGSRPGAPTERNVRRMGFQVAYTKLILVRPGPGLIGART